MGVPRNSKFSKILWQLFHHFKCEVSQSSAERENGTANEHRWSCTGPADQEARERHGDTLGHSPHALHDDEVAVGQVWRTVVPGEHFEMDSSLESRMLPHVRCEVCHHVAKGVEGPK